MSPTSGLVAGGTLATGTNALTASLAAAMRGQFEDRDTFVRNGEMPAYYSSSNIRKLLSRGIMPLGWTELVASYQGFAPEVQAWVLRKNRRRKECLREEDLTRRLTAARFKAAADKSNRDAWVKLTFKRLKRSVVG